MKQNVRTIGLISKKKVLNKIDKEIKKINDYLLDLENLYRRTL